MPGLVLAVTTGGGGVVAKGAGAVSRVARHADELGDLEKVALRAKDLQDARRIGSILKGSRDLLPRRLEALQNAENRIAAIHARDPANVGANQLAPRQTGYYDPNSNTIMCSTECLADRDKTLRTLAHEGRHAYQYHAVEHPEIDPRSGIWRDNFENYVSPDKSYTSYKGQPVESDAFDFENHAMNASH